MINFTTTDQAVQFNGCKVLVYGEAGVGKTFLCATAEAPFIISAEGGELSLRKYAIPMAKVSNVDDISEIYQWFAGNQDNFRAAKIPPDARSTLSSAGSQDSI